jgi:hypothetical protein
MRFFRTKLFILILLATAGATFYYFGDTEKLLSSSMEALNNTPLEGVAQKVQSISTQKDSSEEKTSFDLDNVIQNAEEEFSQLSSRTQEVKEHTENILGATKALDSAINATDDSTPLHERALEYGQYMYCKQVVDDYEKINSL